eukprot:TRINITY_DN8660_c0_g1_i1.p1 TRINITY_DN8660_c0_g1~~TRINITY_DN8660_c0_g1_i1.p1  ORF type:complete len:1090 (+),score=328.13 TRINITY_DN8660_c0_g1_i1:158-3427(+)
MLPQLRGLYTAPELMQHVPQILEKSEELGLRCFSPELIKDNLGLVVPMQLIGKVEVMWNEMSPSKEWMHRFWKYLSNYAQVKMESSNPAQLLNNLHQLCAKFGEVPLIPINNTSLLSMKLCDAVLPFKSEQFSALRDIYQQISAPILSDDFVAYWKLDEMVSPAEIAPIFLHCVSAAQTKCGSNLAVLDAHDKIFIMNLFQTHQDDTGFLFTDQDKTLLKGLPLFQTIRGDFVQVDAVEHFILPELGGPVDLSDGPFLKPGYAGLYQHLGLKTLTSADLYARFILPKFPEYSQDKRMELIQRILHGWNQLRDDPVMVEALSLTCFVETENGIIDKPNALYDPRTPIFKNIFDDSPQSFPMNRNPSWLTFLASVGLKTQLTSITFLDCCRHIHDDVLSDHPSETSVLAAKSSLLLSQLKSNFTKFFNGDFAQKLSTMKIVPAMLMQSKTIVMSSFTESHLPQDQNMCWTVAPIIPKECIPNMESKFGIVSPPPQNVILSHLRNLNDDLIEDWQLSQDVTSVFEEVMDRIHNRWSHWDSNFKESLKNIPLILIQKRKLVKPNRVFFKLKESMSPFLFEIPAEIQKYGSTLKLLGVRESPKTNDYGALFQEIHGTFAGVSLDPNELNTYVNLLNVVSYGRLPGGMYVPNNDSYLRPVQMCYYNDIPWAWDRITHDYCDTVNPRITVELAHRLHINNLSSVIQESLEKGFTPVQVDGSRGEAFTDLINSEEFAQGVEAVIQHMKSHLHFLESLTSTVIRSLLFGYRVVQVESLRTTFKFLPKNINVTKSSEGSLSYIDQTKKVIYIAQNGMVDASSVLSSEICRLLKLPNILPLGSILNTPPHQVTSTLSMLHMVDVNAQNSGRGIPGARVIPSDMPHIRFKPFQTYLPNEIVAFDRDNILRYASVVTDATIEDANDLEIPLRIDGDTITRVPITKVYTFKSARHAIVSEPSDDDPAIPESKKEEQEGPTLHVSEREYIDATKELLSKIGLNLTLNEETLVQNVVSLHSRLAASETHKKELEAENERQKADLENLEHILTCPICRENRPEFIFAPCGHGTCGECQKQWERRSDKVKCPICRTEVAMVVKMFLG